MCPIAGGEKRGNLVVVIVATALSVRLLLRKEQHSLDSSGKKKTCLCCTSFSFLSFLGSFFVCVLCVSSLNMQFLNARLTSVQ